MKREVHSKAYKREVHTKREQLDHLGGQPARRIKPLLKELPDKQKYYEMALTDLRDASNAATLAWTRAVIDERNRRSQELGEAATQKDREDIVNDLLKNATPAVMDLISVATWIEDIYRERLENATEEVLSRKTQKAKIDGLIDLLGMKLMKPGQPQPNQVTTGIEKFGAETITLAIGGLNLSEAGEEFLRENWNAIVKELQRREQAEAAREAFGYFRGSNVTTALLNLPMAKRKTDLDKGEIAYKDVTITLGVLEKVEEGESTLPCFTKVEDLLTRSLNQTVLYLLQCLNDGGVKKGVIAGKVEDFAAKRNITIREAKELLRDGMEVLRHAKITQAGKEAGDFEDVYIFGGTKKILRGNFFFSFNPDFRDAYFNLPVVPIALRIYAVNQQFNPYSVVMGLKLLSHINMNVADKNANRISVEKLLAVCQEFAGMRTYEEVMASDRAVGRRIIEPFERDLNLLEDMNILTWRYADKRKEEAEEYPLTYADFITKNIIFDFLDYPDQSARIEEINKTRAARIKVKKQAALKRLKDNSK